MNQSHPHLGLDDLDTELARQDAELADLQQRLVALGDVEFQFTELPEPPSSFAQPAMVVGVRG